MSKFNVLIVVLLLSFPFLLAAPSCFLYENSPLYCTDLEQGEAESECLQYGDCTMPQYFTTDACSFRPECQKVICKSSCLEEFVGKCITGAIPFGEEAAWCSSGCCSFAYDGQNYCNLKPTKWHCENEAYNRGSPEFSFDTDKDEEICMAFCASGASAGLIPEPVTTEFTPPPSTPLPTTTEDLVELETTAPATSNIWIWGIVLLLFALLIFLVEYKRIKRHVPPVPSENKTAAPIKTFFSPFQHDPVVQERLHILRTKHFSQLKAHEREKLFTAFGIASASERDFFLKLGDLIRRYRRKHPSRVSSPERAVFTRLEELLHPERKKAKTEHILKELQALAKLQK